MSNIETLKDFPESLRPFEKIIFSDKKLSAYDKDLREDFVYSVLKEMAQQCGGMGYFWRAEDESFIFDGWVKGLANFYPFRIVEMLNWILLGKYKKREDFIPRNAMDFKCFMIQVIESQPPVMIKTSPSLLLEFDADCAKEKGKKAREFIKDFIDKHRRVCRVL